MWYLLELLFACGVVYGWPRNKNTVVCTMLKCIDTADVGLVCSFRYVTVHRHYETTSTVFVISGTSQYTVTMKQRPTYLFFPIRHSTPSLWNNVHRLCSFQYVIVHRHYETTSVVFVLSGTSQYTVTMKQRPPYLFFPVRHSTPSLWNNVRRICPFRYVTVHRHYETTSAVNVLSDTSQYTVTMKQRPPYLFFRHSTPSLWNNVRLICSCIL